VGSHGAMKPAGRTRERGDTQPPNEGRVLTYVGEFLSLSHRFHALSFFSPSGKGVCNRKGAG
jgi:hypothetical protein